MEENVSGCFFSEHSVYVCVYCFAVFCVGCFFWIFCSVFSFSTLMLLVWSFDL